MNVPFLQDTTFTGLISTKNYKTSQEWSQAYSLIQANSATWEESADILPTVTNYLSTNNVLVSALNTKGQLLSAGTDLFDIFLTSETDSQTLSYTPSSYLLSISNGNTVNLSSINSLFESVSGKYEDVYTVVQQGSSNWYSASGAAVNAANNFTQTNFFPLTGGIISGETRINNNLTVFGNLTASGTTTFANTVFSTTSALSVVHVGSGPAMWVGNNGTGDIASFYDIDQNIEILHVGGNNGTFPNVGVKTSTPNKTLTVSGEISATSDITNTGKIHTTGGNSDQWNSSYTTVNSNSANWILDGGNTKAANIVIGTNDNYNLNFETAGSTRMTVTSAGSIGINTASPNEHLTVSGNISATGVVYTSGGNSDQWISKTQALAFSIAL